MMGGGGGDALGSLIGAGMQGFEQGGQATAQFLQRDWAKSAARSARNWQERMSNTAVRRAVVDMREAGINPILAVSHGGGGASSGPGPVADTPMSLPSMSGNFLERGASAVKHLSTLKDTVATIRANRERAENEAIASRYLPEYEYHKAGAESERWNQLQATVRLLGAQEQNTNAQTYRTGLDSRLIEMSMPGAKAIEEMYREYPFLRKAKELTSGGLTGSIGGAIGATGAGLGYLWGRRAVGNRIGEGTPRTKKPAKRGNPAR